MVITDAGCTGRFGTVVIDADLPIDKPERKERCLYYESGACLDCVFGCPVKLLPKTNRLIDKRVRNSVSEMRTIFLISERTSDVVGNARWLVLVP